MFSQAQGKKVAVAVGREKEYSSEFMFELEVSSNSVLTGLHVLADAACCSTLLADIVRTHVSDPGLVLPPGFVHKIDWVQLSEAVVVLRLLQVGCYRFSRDESVYPRNIHIEPKYYDVSKKCEV